MPRLFDVLLGRTKPVQADLDALFGLVSAQITMQASESMAPTGQAGVCYKPVAGRSFADTAAETSDLLGLGASTGSSPATTSAVRQQDDTYGFHWVVQSNPDFQELVNQVHLVNSTLQDNGYGPQLLCSVFAFQPMSGVPGASSAPPLAYLVYLYKRGAFYPFVPRSGGGEHRDAETELRLQIVLADDLKIETDKERWMPLWGLPVR
ncbi:MAG: PspA-associated protein PspAB [Acidimicrobiales bacterium]